MSRVPRGVGSLTALVVLFALSCSGSHSDSNGGGACTANTVSPCSCTDGRDGSHTCASDGSGYGACYCSGSSAGGGGAGGAVTDPRGAFDPHKVLCTLTTPEVECQCVRGAYENDQGVPSCNAQSFGGALCFTQPTADTPRCRCMEWSCKDDGSLCDCGANHGDASAPQSCTNQTYLHYCYDPDNEDCLGWNSVCNAGEEEVPSCDGAEILPRIVPHHLASDPSNPNGFGIADCVEAAASLPDPPTRTGTGGASSSTGGSSGGGNCDPSVCNGIESTCSDGLCIYCESACRNGTCETTCS